VTSPGGTEHGPGAVPGRWRLGRRPLVGGVEILGGRLRRELARNTQADETVRFCVRGKAGHALVCLGDRLLIVKHGARAGAAFGTMAATIFYRDVTGIQVRMHLLSGWIEISTPSFQGTERKRPAQGRPAARHGVIAQPNCISVRRRHVELYHLALSELRRLVADAKLEHGEQGVVAQLDQLGALYRRGVVDDREFALAKARILGGAPGEVTRLARPA
jgi:hypothetical protein